MKSKKSKLASLVAGLLVTITGTASADTVTGQVTWAMTSDNPENYFIGALVGGYYVWYYGNDRAFFTTLVNAKWHGKSVSITTSGPGGPMTGMDSMF